MQKHHPGVKRLEIAPAELVPDFAMIGMIAEVVGARLFIFLNIQTVSWLRLRP